MMNLSSIANALAQAAVAVGRSVELSLLLKATMVMLLGLAAVRLARNARASVRHVVLSATFASLFLLPLAILNGPTVAIGVPIATTGPTLEATGTSLRLVDGPPLPAPERVAAVAVSRWPATIPSGTSSPLCKRRNTSSDFARHCDLAAVEDSSRRPPLAGGTAVRARPRRRGRASQSGRSPAS